MADIGPELPDDVIEGGSFDLGGPILGRPAEATLLWRVIKVGQARFHDIAHNLREIKAYASRIGPGQDDLR